MNNKDFTIREYRKLLQTFKTKTGTFCSFLGSFSLDSPRFTILRHDVDELPVNSMEFAEIQSSLGITSTYYFRSISGSFDKRIIESIAGLGHEIGYHYEDMSFAWAKLKTVDRRLMAEEESLVRKVVDIGIESFNEHLTRLREIAQVKTICMHGSPMNRWDSRLLWKYYDYHDLGIVGEPYFDLDFEEVMYLTDTGRRWDGDSVSVRDKGLGTRNKGLVLKDKGQGEQIKRSESEYFKDWKVKPVAYRQKTNSEINLIPNPHSLFPNQRFHSTSDIIKATLENKLPNKIMMTFHPQRWTDKPLPWVKELVWQNLKNTVKYFVVRNNSH